MIHALWKTGEMEQHRLNCLISLKCMEMMILLVMIKWLLGVYFGVWWELKKYFRCYKWCYMVCLCGVVVFCGLYVGVKISLEYCVISYVHGYKWVIEGYSAVDRVM